MASFQTTIEQLDAEQGGNQLANSGITLGWNGNNLKIKKNGVEISAILRHKEIRSSKRQSRGVFISSYEKHYPREASRKDYECRGLHS